jgi:ABC-type multidrug transport system ATPase subunit
MRQQMKLVEIPTMDHVKWHVLLFCHIDKGVHHIHFQQVFYCGNVAGNYYMSTSPLIKITGLSHSYARDSKTLMGINLQVERGSIYGFLGPNGSGKTTTLSLLLGLLRVQEGSIELFGETMQGNRTGILKRVGSLIESPSLYGHLTARENLEVYRSMYGTSKERIDEVLSIVGLETTGKKLAKKFSLGTKQRLAIALALLPKPELLILDEPSNGLDPNGIIELRELVKKLNKVHGMTIIISSHILSEVEKMVSHIGIISQGKMLFQGSVKDLQLMQQSQSVLQVNTSDNDTAYKLLQRYAPERNWQQLLVPYASNDDVAMINRVLISNNLDVYKLQPKENNLEQLFIELTTTQS